jgi:ribosomal-protein-alanine N-acetyltransferase
MKMLGYKLRAGERDDAVAMKMLDELCFPEPVQYGKIEFLYLLTKPDVVSYVLETNNNLVGFIMSSIEVTKKTANIITLDVHPSYRQRGFATRLLKKIESALKTRNLLQITLQVGITNKAAISFYQKHGYRIMKKISDYYPDEDAYLMAKMLSC